MLRLFSVLCFAISFFVAKSQTPFLHNYTQEDSPSIESCFAIFQSKEGKMYISGRNTLYTYNGANWGTVLAVSGFVRALAEDSKGTIFVGTTTDLGYLEKQKDGKEKFISISKSLSEEEKLVPTIWDVQVIQDTIYFQSQRFIFVFVKDELGYKKIASIPSIGDIIFSFQVGQEIYIVETNEEGTLTQLNIIKQGKKFQFTNKNQEILSDIFGIEEISPDKLMIVTGYQGLYYMDKNTGDIVAVPEADQEFFSKANIYCSLLLKNNTIALGTHYEGVIIIDKEGKVLEHISDKNGLNSNNILSLYEDKQQTLWVGAGTSLAKIHLGIPFRSFNKFYNIKESVYDFINHQGTLYAATNIGVFYLENDKFVLIPGTQSQCWRILPYQKGLMVAGGNSGLFYIENKKLISKLAAPNSVMNIAISKKNEQIIYVATYNGLRVFQFINQEIKDLGALNTTQTDCRSLFEMPDGKLWLGTTNNGYYLVDFVGGNETEEAIKKAKVKKYAAGLNEMKRNIVYNLKDKPYFSSLTALYDFNFQKESFEKINFHQIDFSLSQNQAPNIFQDRQDNIWILNTKTILKKTEKGYESDSISLKPLIKKPNGIYQESEDKFFLFGSDGIFLFYKNWVIPTNKFRTQVNQVFLSNSKQNLPIIDTNLVLPYEHNSLLFQVASNSYFMEKENQYQFFLENYDEHWSDWTNINQKEYTNLREGTYTFRVRSKNIYGQEGEEAILVFEISAPWYRTWWAYSAYAVLALLSLWGFAKIYTLKLKRENENLERIVQERTQEVVRQNNEILAYNEELKMQKEEIEAIADTLQIAYAEINQKNIDITAGFNYAKRIQAAMLPFPERIAQGLGEENFFIFYKPRDIVSGDFYWYHQEENIITLIAADCTGHGVPGALMSMIGNQLLYEIIIIAQIQSPDEVLQKLGSEVIRVLKQKETSNRDGMDIAMIVIDKNKQEMNFAGAKNPLVYFQNGEMKVLKGDKISIGGEHENISQKFTKHIVDITESTTLYLFSDGFQDQFGGVKGKKYMVSRFYQLLQKNYQETMPRQAQVLEEELNNWMEQASEKQTDDILVIGVKI